MKGTVYEGNCIIRGLYTKGILHGTVYGDCTYMKGTIYRDCTMGIVQGHCK